MNADVLFIYEWFKRVLSSTGRKMTDPDCADITKTYRYRSVNKFVKKARDLGLDKNQMQILVKEIIIYVVIFWMKPSAQQSRSWTVLNRQHIYLVNAYCISQRR